MGQAEVIRQNKMGQTEVIRPKWVKLRSYDTKCAQVKSNAQEFDQSANLIGEIGGTKKKSIRITV